MAAEARAMLDALMGQDRNTSIVPAPKDGNQDWDSLRKKKSCYDKDVCPLYCAWGVDLYELFTNTKSDLGPNPYQVRDDAREEYLSLPEHEKDRLGFERMLHRKLGDLVRSCDRIVSRNKEKLRQEIAQAAKKRGINVSRIDPVTDVSDEMIMEAAEIMADLELHEEQVSVCLVELTKVDDEWKKLWDELQLLLQTSNKDAVASSITTTTTTTTATTTGNSNNTGASTETDNLLQNGENLLESNVKEEKTEQDTQHEHNDSKEDETNFDEITLDKIKTVKSRLYALSSEQQKIIAKIANMTTQTIVPLRDNLLNLTKQLYYVKTDMSEDKTVCEVSGNFMSFRDAEERIAAHYAGKQYVGWKMVRDKFKELEQKAKSWRSGPVGPSSVSNVGRYGGGGGGGGGSNRGGYGPPQPSRGHGYPPPITGQGGRGRQGDRYGYGHPDRNDRSRSRDGGDSQRWERDRGPVPRGGSGGEYSRRNDRRGWK